MSNFSPMFFEQPIVIFDATESTNSTSGAFVLYGGVSINATYDSSTTSSGAFVLSGGMAVQKNISVGGIQHIYNTTQSSSDSNGALVVDGGVGIAKNLNVGGNTTILGNLYVEGTYTYVNSQTINVEDNTLVINAGPAGSRDAGLLIRRDGIDVTGDNSVTSGTLLALENVNGTSITFGSSHQQADHYYRGWWVELDGSNGYAQIDSYSSALNAGILSTVGNTLTGGNLTETGFTLYNRSYMGQYYDEQSDEIRFAYIADAQDPKIDLENNNNYADLRLKNILVNDTISTANLTLTGFATIANLALSSASLTDATISNLHSDNTSIGSLYVDYNSILHGSVTAGALNVTGTSILQGTVTAGALAVTGESFLRGAVTAGALNVTGDSILQGTVTAGALAVTGESFLRGAVTAGALNVTGNSILQGTVTAGGLNVTGVSILQGGITAGSLYVTGPSILDLGITTGTINVTGDSILHGGITAGSLYVTGPSILDLGITTGTINVTGVSILHGGITAGSLYVTGPSILDLGITTGTINVTGDSILHGGITTGSLYVTGPSILDLGITTGTINVTGVSILHGGITAGSLYVTGASILDLGITTGTINVTGDSILHGTVTAGALNVTGVSILHGFVTAGSLNVTGASIMEDNLTVTTGSVTISTNDYLPIIGGVSATGGAIIFNTVDVSPSLGDISRERIFNAANNVSSATNITGFVFDNSIVRAFDAIVSVTILDETTNKYAYYNLKGIHKLSNWVINSSYVGDVTGFTFSIDNNGQIKYTSTNITGYLSSSVNFRAMTTSARSNELPI